MTVDRKMIKGKREREEFILLEKLCELLEFFYSLTIVHFYVSDYV